MEKKFCKICGSELILCLNFPQYEWYIEENQFVRADNSLSDKPQCFLICSKDREHDVSPEPDDQKFDQWVEELKVQFHNQVYSTLL